MLDKSLSLIKTTNPAAHRTLEAPRPADLTALVQLRRIRTFQPVPSQKKRAFQLVFCWLRTPKRIQSHDKLEGDAIFSQGGANSS